MLGVAFAFFLPAFEHAQRVARARSTIQDLRRFDNAFQDYASSHGNWPPADAMPGEYPTGMKSALAETSWRKPAPIGGRYVFLRDTPQRGERLHAAIAIVSFRGKVVSEDKRQLEELLRQAKAGGLGKFRLELGFLHEPIYVLEH